MRRKKTIGSVLLAGIPLKGLAVWVSARPTTFQGGAPPLAWAECAPEQVEVLILGTYHFAQVSEIDDILSPERQRELAELLDALEDFRPDRVAVEHPYARRDGLDSLFRQTLETPPDRLRYRNETVQIGFRLARRLGHETVYPVDVPIPPDRTEPLPFAGGGRRSAPAGDRTLAPARAEADARHDAAALRRGPTPVPASRRCPAGHVSRVTPRRIFPSTGCSQ